MNNEDLELLKDKISKLTEEELKMRDSYLRQIAVGEIFGPSVGYASVDKPWLKYFEKENISLEKNIKTIYQILMDNDNFDQNIAIEFFGKKITFKELKNKVKETAQALLNSGVKQGDYVTICMAGIPETAYLFFALAGIGAIGDFIPPYLDKESLQKNINNPQSSLLICMDSFYKYLKDNVINTSIQNTVIVPTLNSSPVRFVKKGEHIDYSKNVISWNKFIKENSKGKEFVLVEYQKDLPVVVVYSSGTSGFLKGIVLSNDSFLNSNQAYLKSGVEIEPKNKMYQIIPPWSSTGLSTSLFLPLANGSAVFMDPRFDKKIFAKNIIKHKINYSIATTSLYEGLYDEGKLNGKNLKFLKYPFEGGEAISQKSISNIEKVFHENGTQANLRVGYGQCEAGATISTETSKTDHNIGSVGIPLPGINIKVVDEYGNELPYGQRGILLVDTECRMLEYFENKDLTDSYFIVDRNGKKWNNTQDIAYIDKNGNIFIEGRSRDFTMVNEEKIYNFDIERLLNSLPFIKDSEVLTKIDSNGNPQLAAHIILNERIKIDEELLIYIQNYIYDKTQSCNSVPFIFKVRDVFPQARSTKRDTKKMSEETDGFTIIKEYIKTKHL